MEALRVAARRLVGGGQMPAVAVDKAQRRLFPSFSQVGRARSTTSSAAAAADTNGAAGKGCEDREKLLTEIRNMTEELYDKVSHAERIYNYNIPGREGKNMSRLHEELATQVGPRPGDYLWRSSRVMHRLTYYVGYASFMFTSFVLGSMAAGSIVELEPDEKRWIQKKRGEARKRSEAK